MIQNSEFILEQWVEVEMKLTLNVSDQKDIPENKHGSFANLDNLYMAGDSPPIMPVYHPDGHFAGYSGNGYFTNMPAFLSQGGDRSHKTNDAWVTSTIRLTPFAGFAVNADYTYNYYNATRTHVMNEYWDYDALGPATLFPHTTPNWVRKDEQDDRYYALNIFAEYEKDFGNHYFKSMVGFNQEEKQFNSFWVRRSNLISNEIPYISVASGERNGGDAASDWAIRGGFFRLNYTYNDRYLLE